MAFVDWNRMCSFCGRYMDARHGKYADLFAIVPDLEEGEIRACEDCKEFAEEVKRRFLEKNPAILKDTMEMLNDMED